MQRLNEDEASRLNTVEELANGILKTRLNDTGEYTILLIGETGTGKTTFLSLLANVLSGRSSDNYALYHDSENEAGGAEKHSQTNSARLYKFKSQNGVTVRIVDTPGLTDTRGFEQDNEHKASIARCIKKYVSVVNAVLVLANGTSPRLGAATHYALSNLSAFFPRGLSANIGLLLTNVSNPLLLNFDQESLPMCLRDEVNQFLLDNPIAMWKKYSDLCFRSTPMKAPKALKSSLNDAHHKALTCLVYVFDWLDGLDPQPTKGILDLHEKSLEMEQKIADFLSRIRELGSKKKELEAVLREARDKTLAMEQNQNFQRTVTEKVWIYSRSSVYNSMCFAPVCYSNCPFEQSGIKSVRSIRVPGSQYVAPSLAVISALGASISGTSMAWAGGIGAGVYFAALYLLKKKVRPEDICPHCYHSYELHLYGRLKWEQEDHRRIVIDTEAQRKHVEAMAESARREMELEADYEKTIDTLNSNLEDCLSNLSHLTEECAKQSLSGSSTGPVRKTVVQLELTLDAMRSDGTDPTTLQKVGECLENIQGRLQQYKE